MTLRKKKTYLTSTPVATRKTMKKTMKMMKMKMKMKMMKRERVMGKRKGKEGGGGAKGGDREGGEGGTETRERKRRILMMRTGEEYVVYSHDHTQVFLLRSTDFVDYH